MRCKKIIDIKKIRGTMMKKLIIILTVLTILTYTVSFVAATPPPPTTPPGGAITYVPGYSLGGVFYLFTMFAGLYLLLNILPPITHMLKGGPLR